MDVVNKLLDVFRSLKGDKDGKKKAGPIIAIAIGSIAAIIIAILSFRAWKTGKKMAKLLHEKAVNEEKSIQAVTDVQLAKSEEEKQAAAAKIAALRARFLEIAEAIQEAQTTFDQAKETIHEIETWDDFDEFTRG